MQDAHPEPIARSEPARGGYPDPAGLGLSGRDRLREWLREGVRPPLAYLTGAVPTAVGEGTAEARMPASPWLLNSAGLIGGGTLAMLADIAFGCAIETKMPAATPYTTAELSLTFLRPVRQGGTLSAHGQAIHLGGRVGVSEVFVLDATGEELMAHGTSRLAVLPTIDPVPQPTAQESEADPVYETPHPYLREPVAGGVLPQEVWAELPGGEILGRQLTGELPPPPIHFLTGLELRDAGGGGAVMTMPASEWLASPTGLLQGGTIAMQADSAMQAAVLSTAPAETAIAGLDLKVNYLRPGVADGRDLTARAEIMHAGRTLAITRCEIANADGKPVALATGSTMYLPGRPAALGDVELSAVD